MNYNNVELHNVSDIITEEGQPGFTITRLPKAILPEINPNAQQMSLLSGGAEIRGMLPKEGKAKVVLQVLDDNCVPPIVSVFFGSFRNKQVLLSKDPMAITIEAPEKMDMMETITKDRNLPFNPRLVRIRLPHIHRVRILSIEGGLTYPEPQALPEKTMLCYGSSITHGAHAIPPEGTYASVCAQQLGYDVINLGLGGAAQMDTAVADHIAARTDWDVATLEMGINVRTWPPEKFRDAVDHFVSTIVAAHPNRYIFCIDLFTNDFDFMDEPPGAIGFREIVGEIVAKQNSSKVIHVDGRSILTNPAGLQTDLVHPSDEGMNEMGRNLADVIKTYIQ